MDPTLEKKFVFALSIFDGEYPNSCIHKICSDVKFLFIVVVLNFKFCAKRTVYLLLYKLKNKPVIGYPDKDSR